MGVCLAGICLISAASIKVSTAQEAREGREEVPPRLAERLEMLEKSVLRDPYKPQETVLARLDRLEVEVQRHTGKDARADARVISNLEKAVEASRRQGEDLARRLKAIEADRGAESITPREVQALRREIDRASDALEDLADRVQRLEARR